MDVVESVPDSFTTFIAHLKSKFLFQNHKNPNLPISANLQYFLLYKHYLKLFLSSIDDEHHLYIA